MQKFSIALISMPLTLLTIPSLAMSLLKTRIEHKFNSVSVKLIYGFLDFVEFIGWEKYNEILSTWPTLIEWLFRPTAFPVAPDNADLIKERLLESPLREKQNKRLLTMLMELRSSIDSFLDNMVQTYNLQTYDVIGFTSMLSQNLSSFSLMNKIKKSNPDCIVIMGGPNCDFPMGQIIIEHFKNVDYVFSGEGLDTFQAFVEYLLNNQIENTHQIDGVFSKKNKIKSIGNELISLEKIENSNYVSPYGTLASMDSTDLEIEFQTYLEKLKETSFANEIIDKITLTFRTSTGCRWADKIKCTFCGLNTISKHTHMSNNKARNYIDWLIEKYSKDFPFFMAVDLTLPHNYPRDVFLKQKNIRNNTVIYEVRADISKEEMIILKNAGVTILQPGIESLSTETLKRMHKGTTSFTNIQFLKNALEIGIYPVWLWLYGLPDEVDSNIFEDMTRTLELIKHLPPPTAANPIIFTRFSSYFDQSTEYGLELKPASFYSLLYPYNDDVIEQLAYHFSDHKREKPYVDAYRPYQGIFGAMILDWIISFYNANKNPPMLIFDNNKIIDTRSKRRIEYSPSITGREMLQFLDTPRSLMQIETKFTDYRRILDDLLKRGFIFEDREKYMSLVCSKIDWNNSEYKRLWNFVNSSTLRPIPFHSFQENST